MMEVFLLSETSARRLAAMLTDQQRRDVLQLAQAIIAPADFVPPADVPKLGTGDAVPVRG